MSGRACHAAPSKPVLEYACPGCGARYDTLQAAYLIDLADGQFHCERCGAVLASAEDARSGGGGEGARQERLRATKALQVGGTASRGVLRTLFPSSSPMLPSGTSQVGSRDMPGQYLYCRYTSMYDDWEWQTWWSQVPVHHTCRQPSLPLGAVSLLGSPPSKRGGVMEGTTPGACKVGPVHMQAEAQLPAAAGPAWLTIVVCR